MVKRAEMKAEECLLSHAPYGGQGVLRIKKLLDNNYVY